MGGEVRSYQKGKCAVTRGARVRRGTGAGVRVCGVSGKREGRRRGRGVYSVCEVIKMMSFSKHAAFNRSTLFKSLQNPINGLGVEVGAVTGA